MTYDLSGKSLAEVLKFLKDKGYIPTIEDYLQCSDEDCEYAGYDETNEYYIHEKYNVTTFKCDCGKIFYEVLPKDDRLPNQWKTKDGVMVGLE